ncbi:MMPL family transporter [Gordonia sp. CPCC 205515]|uniref:MMPL family transporter n=1 Tax=Gordonia sp. CPCC 205515 TaxID=3140791 RepID=UPI003AF3C1DA
MFGAIGTFVYRMRFAVIAVLIALMGGLGLYGLDLGKHLSQSGWFDPTSESAKGSVVADTALGRDHRSDVILLITPPAGTTVDDPEFGAKVENFMDALLTEHGDIVNREDPGIIDPFYQQNSSPAAEAAQQTIRERTFTDNNQHAFISIGVKGNDDTTVLNNYKTIEPFFDNIAERYDMPGTTFQLAGLQPVAGAMSRGMDEDIRRAEVIALPVVAIMLFFIFGGVVAACLPVLIGGLTIAGSLGIMKILAQVTELNIFAQSVVTLIGLGIAIDYGLFIVSRFREELAEGYSTKAAVRRSVMTSGQTVVFSATIIVAALACLLIMPQGFLKSVAYGAIASVTLAALLSITVLPAILSILGRRVDALSLPFLNRTKTREEIENGFWGRLSGWVMQHPVATAVPTVALLLLLAIPFGGIKFGGISEAYLPPDNPSRIAQEDFDKYFPAERTEEIKLVIAYDPNDNNSGEKLQAVADEANKIPGFTKQFSTSATDGALSGQYGDNGPQILQMSAGLVDRDTAGEAIKDLRAIDKQGLTMWVAGTPTLTQDSIDALMSRLPLMAILLVLVTGLLMFLAFGSLVLPIKAALMSALGLAATLGILTWIFVDGHGASIANFTPGPLFAAVLVLIIAIVFGLSTDYEIFLLSRMVEARQKGASTTDAIRIGTAHTGRIITAAAAILVVVTGAFGLSEIVMMKYIAYGMIAALILDATIIRMLLVPSVMKLLGDDCWWAPRWMQRWQRKIGLGETLLDDEPDELTDNAHAHAARSSGSLVAAAAAAGSGATIATMPRPTVRPDSARGPARMAQRSAPTAPRPTETPGPQPAPSGPAPVQPATATPTPPAPRPPMPPRRGRGRSDRPDTGGWKLGAGGIRLGSNDVAQPPARPAVPPRNGAPHPAPQPTPPAGAPKPPATPAAPLPPTESLMNRRPALDATGKRPLAASLTPEAPTPASQSAPKPADQTDQDATRSDRHARTDEDGQRGQISVQELLRRSRRDS